MTVPEGGSGPEPAGIVSRGVAAVLDVLVLVAACFAVQAGVGCVRLLVTGPPFRFPEPSLWLSGLSGWVLAVLYLACSWAAIGRTAGDRLMGLRVTDRAGARLGLPRSLLRAALCVTFPLGLVWIPFSRRRAALQDLVVVSAVRYDWR
ncbi:RDD family protein [Streptomyces longisporoflavus]|uniref:RDD family protein n=1 Tax=Streptomyces longisporoflavus TaxID=28044 RepID=A0ABW7QPN8_9ACTN